MDPNFNLLYRNLGQLTATLNNKELGLSLQDACIPMDMPN